jgi:hypothetical protein
VTNNNGGTGIRIPQPVYLFTVLMAATVALLVIVTSFNGGEVVRPRPTAVPVDPFANLSYQTYVSPDGIFQLEHPTTWMPQTNPTTQLVTDFLPTGGDMQTGMQIYFTALRALQNLPEDKSPENLVKEALRQGDVLPSVTPVTVSGLTGSCGETEVDLRDGTKGKVEICVVPIDEDHLVVLNAITHADQWARMEPIVERLKSSLQIKVESAIARMAEVLGAQAPETTPEATAAATAEATAEATVEATAGATAEATAEATAAATSEATAEATSEPTEAATSEPTQAATAEATPVQ